MAWWFFFNGKYFMIWGRRVGPFVLLILTLSFSFHCHLIFSSFKTSCGSSLYYLQLLGWKYTAVLTADSGVVFSSWKVSRLFSFMKEYFSLWTIIQAGLGDVCIFAIKLIFCTLVWLGTEAISKPLNGNWIFEATVTIFWPTNPTNQNFHLPCFSSDLDEIYNME